MPETAHRSVFLCVPSSFLLPQRINFYLLPHTHGGGQEIVCAALELRTCYVRVCAVCAGVHVLFAMFVYMISVNLNLLLSVNRFFVGLAWHE